jgi:hypothetical protein
MMAGFEEEKKPAVTKGIKLLCYKKLDKKFAF